MNLIDKAIREPFPLTEKAPCYCCKQLGIPKDSNAPAGANQSIPSTTKMPLYYIEITWIFGVSANVRTY